MRLLNASQRLSSKFGSTCLVIRLDYIQPVLIRRREKAQQKNSFDLLRVVHEAETKNLKPVPPAHRFEVTLEPDTYTEEKFLLYKDYQINVHHDSPDEVSGDGFKRFLC